MTKSAVEKQAYQRLWNASHPGKKNEYARRSAAKKRSDPIRRKKMNEQTNIWRAARLKSDPDFRESERLRRKNSRATPEKWAKTKVREIKIKAQKHGLDFDLTAEWLLQAIPQVCPIFQTHFVFGSRSPYNASVDRLLPDGGYTRVNVRVISQEANLIKRRCADPKVFRRLALWLEFELASGPVVESRVAA